MERGINYGAASEKVENITSVKNRMDSIFNDEVVGIINGIADSYQAQASTAVQGSLVAYKNKIMDELEGCINTMNEAINTKSEDYQAWDSKQAGSVQG